MMYKLLLSLVIFLPNPIYSQGSDLVINEFMALNENSYIDEYEQFDDWLELYNNGSETVNLSGFYLTDDFNNPTKWQFPGNAPELTTLKPGEFLVIWMDEDLFQGLLHADFKLSGDGEQLGLYGKDGLTPIDTLTFGVQSPNISYGRKVDGGNDWGTFSRPTPGRSNSFAHQVPEYFIECDPDSFDYLYENYSTDNYISVTFRHAGRTWSNVRMRIRGDSSRQLPKKSLKLKFDSDLFITGRDVLNFNAEYINYSYLHVVLSSMLMRKSGQPCFEAEHARLYLNGEFLGLYVNVENVDSDFLKKRDLNPDGNLYKATLDGACMSIYDDVNYHWEKKTNEDENRDDLTELIQKINYTPDNAYFQFIQQHFYYDQMVNIIAMNLLLNNGSTYYHNYFMYRDLISGKWTMLPWDMDRTFNGYSTNLPYHRSSNYWTPDNPFLERAVLNEQILNDIRARIDELERSFFNLDYIEPTIDSLKTSIAVSVTDDITDDVPDTTFWISEINKNKSYISMRYSYLQNQFDDFPRSFKIDRNPQVLNSEITFTWHPATDPNGDEITYTFKYSPEPNFVDSFVTEYSGITDTLFTLQPPPPEGSYYWIVSAEDGTNSVEGFDTWNPLTVEQQELNLTLPKYRIEIAPDFLQQLFEQPYKDDEYSAKFYYNSQKYECEVRFRGSTSRDLPKKSWRIEFDNSSNLFSAEVINLNSEYRDRSLMRNHLTMKLFQKMGSAAPQSQYVNLYVNDEYMGVFLQIERVDEDFLNRTNRLPNTLYKAVNHGASMAPLLKYDDYPRTWGKKIGQENDFTDIATLFNKLLYWTKQDFENLVEDEFVLENVLNYFAIQYAIVNNDGITKNLYFYFNSDLKKWEIFPWDNDATFGNNWEGVYKISHENLQNIYHLDYHLLFQRLIENPVWKNIFISKLNEITSTGFDWLGNQADFTYNLIKNDVYQDTAKICTNREFDDEINVFKNFLQKRREALQGFSTFGRIPLYNEFISNPFPTLSNPDITFRVSSEAPQSVSLVYSTDLDYENSGEPFTTHNLELYDDGQHDDVLAGDLIYGNTLTIHDSLSALIPFAFQGNYAQPGNGLHYINYIPTKTFNLSLFQAKDEIVNSIRIGDVFEIKDNYIVTIINTSSGDINLSNYHLQIDAYYNNITFPPGTVITAQDTLIVTNNSNLTATYFNKRTVAAFLPEIEISDTLKLLTPTLYEVDSKVIEQFTSLDFKPIDIVINEINYHSNDRFDTDDWVEFYNPNDFDVNLSGWIFKDQEDDHIFEFPAHTVIMEKDYLILCENISKFKEHFPESENITGEFDFGLSRDGELLRLFDVTNRFVDSLAYQNSLPWPLYANGYGSTLELKEPALDNSIGFNWKASPIIGGTPGRANNNLKPIVITEINYNSKDDFDPDDWIEFYNPNDFIVNISDWTLAKGAQDTFILPMDIEIEANDYLVICKNKSKFKQLFPEIYNCFGNFHFSLNRDGEVIRLFDITEQIVDTLAFKKSIPWQAEANGFGATLELKSPDLDNSQPSNWRASAKIGGTPGKPNSDSGIEDDGIPDSFQLFQNFPNPFNPETLIRFHIPESGHVKFRIYNIKGELVQNIIDEVMAPNTYSYNWNATGLSSGIYFIHLMHNGNVIDIKKTILVK